MEWSMDRDSVNKLRAIEALRAGVPNRDVVRELPPVQADVEDRFDALLEVTGLSEEDQKPLPGLLLEGDFGTGKSHWLEYFRHLALDANFICSTVVLNKETPLYDLNKVYRACVEAAVAPDRTGPALAEIVSTYRPDSAPRYREFVEWINRTPGLDARYGATLALLAQGMDEQWQQKIILEWTGDPMKVVELREALQAAGAGSLRVGKAEKTTPLQRYEFLTRFFRSAGYSGWVVLLDEAEMISKYSLRQRGKAYAHLAQLLGLQKGAAVPGLAAVFTITKDYAGEVLYGKKNDKDNIPAKLTGTRDEEVIGLAEIGMKAISSRGTELRPPSADQVQEVYSRVWSLYTRAYDWSAPDISNRREHSQRTAMRQHIRSWINTWDLRRLYDYQAHLVVEEVTVSLDEDADMQTEALNARADSEDAKDGEGAHNPHAVNDDEPYITL
jgi:hypothetical protein